MPSANMAACPVHAANEIKWQQQVAVDYLLLVESSQRVQTPPTLVADVIQYRYIPWRLKYIRPEAYTRYQYREHRDTSVLPSTDGISAR